MSEQINNKVKVIAQVTDNTALPGNYLNLGILRFAKMFYPKVFSYDFDRIHYDMCQTYFSLLDPRKTTSEERQSYFVVHREAAKSTIGTFLIPLYNIFLKGYDIKLRGASFGYHKDDPDYNKIFSITLDEKFIMIISETGESAEMFATNLKEAIDKNILLPKIFGEKHPQYIIEDSDHERSIRRKWSKRMFVTADDTVVLGIGAGMQVRGRLFKGSRPTLILIDDLYSENNTRTEESLKKIDRWFYNALLNSQDSNYGKAMLFGTVVHPESIPAKVINDYAWKGVVKPIISQRELELAKEFVAKHNGFNTGLLYDDKFKAKLTEFSYTLHTLSWPKYHPLVKILQKYDKALHKKSLDNFYQEYMNIPVPPEDQWIDENTFQKSDIQGFIKDNKQYVRFTFNGAKWEGIAVLDIGIDLGSALSTKSNETVICLVGYALCLPDIPGIDTHTTQSSGKYSGGTIFPVLLEMNSGKMDLFDYEDMFKIDIPVLEKGSEGVGNIIIELNRRYKINRIKAEANGQQETALRGIKAFLKHQGVTIPFWPEYINQDKKEKIISVVRPIVNKHHRILIGINAHKYISIIYTQLLTLGMPGTADDHIDSIAIGYKESKEPRKIPVYQHPVAKRREMESTDRVSMLKKKYGKNWWDYL